MRYAWGGPPAAVVVEASFVTGKVGVSEAGDGGVDVFIFFRSQTILLVSFGSGLL